MCSFILIPAVRINSPSPLHIVMVCAASPIKITRPWSDFFAKSSDGFVLEQLTIQWIDLMEYC